MDSAEMKGLVGGSNTGIAGGCLIDEQPFIPKKTPEERMISDLMDRFPGHELPESLKSMLLKFGYKDDILYAQPANL